MSVPIKPPGGGSSTGGPAPSDAPKPPGERGAVDRSFGDTMDQSSTGAVGASERAASEAAGKATSGEAVAGPDTVAGITEDLREGRIDRDQAIDRLVARQLEGALAQALPPAARAELEAQLRRALVEDPALSALAKDLERGQ